MYKVHQTKTEKDKHTEDDINCEQYDKKEDTTPEIDVIEMIKEKIKGWGLNVSFYMPQHT